MLSERGGGGTEGGCDRDERRRERRIKRDRWWKKRRGGKRQEMRKAGEIYVLGSVQRSNACVCCQINMSCRRTSCHVKSLLSPLPVCLHCPAARGASHTKLHSRWICTFRQPPSFQTRRQDFKHWVVSIILSIKYNSGVKWEKHKKKKAKIKAFRYDMQDSRNTFTVCIHCW